MHAVLSVQNVTQIRYVQDSVAADSSVMSLSFKKEISSICADVNEKARELVQIKL